MGTKSLIKIALFSALIAIGAFIKISFLFVPMTLQTLFVLLAELALTKLEAISMSVYTFASVLSDFQSLPVTVDSAMYLNRLLVIC